MPSSFVMQVIDSIGVCMALARAVAELLSSATHPKTVASGTAQWQGTVTNSAPEAAPPQCPTQGR